MNFNQITNRHFLRNSYSNSTIAEANFLRFLDELKIYLKALKNIQLEENGKSYLRNLLFSTGYENSKIEAVGNIDLAIFKDLEQGNSQIEVIFETKKPNSPEMITDDNFFKKSFAQICYYFVEFGSSSLKHLIITDYKTLYLFKAGEIEKITKQNSFPKWRKTANTETIYKDILKANLDLSNLKFTKIDFTQFSISQIDEVALHLYSKNHNIFNIKRNLTAIYKLLSPKNLLEIDAEKDMNSLDEKFYQELLHIFGVEEKTIDGVQKIVRKEKNERDFGSFLELTFLENPDLDFETAFGINIVWLNRILFLKLLEARLVFMHPNFSKFMNIETIPDFQTLETLFFEVMAVEIPDRKPHLKKFKKIPYINSSLFERKNFEEKKVGLCEIRNLNSNLELELYEKTVLDTNRKKLKTLEYLFQFLNSYDFGSNKYDEIAKIDKTLIKSSVLGLIFEKVNGYKDGSHFTPSFITTKLAKDSLDKFPQEKLKDIKVLDPAVGSGHILVSILNELVVRQAEIYGRFGKKRDLTIDIENDEIFIPDDVQYIQNPDGSFPEIAENIQFEIFHLKKRIIENNLFGVDINPKSVEIARLRLWIELLKWSYYDENGKFTTLPNIDINIKVGNSLLSRFEIDEKLEKKKTGELLNLVKEYIKTKDKTRKKEIEKKIKEIKSGFVKKLGRNSKDVKNIIKKLDKYIDLHGITGVEEFYSKYVEKLFYPDKPKKGYKKELKQILELHKKIKFLENMPESFEWRFEFPEVLNKNGDFVGFDLIVANPPYIRQEKIKDLKPFLETKYKIYSGTADIYTYFFELGLNLLSKNGVLSFITSNKWTRAKYGLNLRRMILEKCDILQYVNLNGIKVFDHATVDTSLISLQHKKGNSTFKYCNGEMRLVQREDRKEKEYFYDCFDYDISDLTEDSFSFANKKELEIKKHIEKIGTPLKDWDIKINYGIKTGFNEAFIISTEKRNEILENCQSEDERKRTEKIIKKLLRGRDIKRYKYEWANLWLINFHNNPPLEISKYPAIKKHLDKFYSKLAKRKDKGKTPYNLRNCAYLEEFEKEKIIFSKASKETVFAFDNKNIFFDVTAYMLSGLKLKYLTSILNSNFFINIESQLIATTHEIFLLDIKKLFRKDEIWFMKKHQNRGLG